MSTARQTVSLVWLVTNGRPPVERAWSAFCASCPQVTEAILVGPTTLEPRLQSLSTAFPQQTIVLHDPGESFASAAIRAVALARNPCLLFVTCPVSASAGWLEPLLQLMEADGSIGIATPCLIGNDGRVAAAGSVAWADGTCEPFGEGDRPHSAACTFRREVPVAPPSVLIVKAAAIQDGGFDPMYRSETYAVADLCLSLRSRGLTAVYQPRAQLVVDPGPVDPAAETADRRHFQEKWASALEELPAPAAPGDRSWRRWLAGRDALARERILVVDDRVPGPDRGSGDPRMFTMLQEMVTLWPTLRVTVAAMTDLHAEANKQRLLDAGLEVAHGEHWPSWFHDRRYHYGIVLMSRPQAGAVDEWIRTTQPQAFRIYDAEALVYRRLERMLPIVEPAGRTELRNQIREVRSREIEYLAAADEIFCVSPEEQRVARALAPPGTPVFVLPFCVDVVDTPPGFATRRDILYFGGFMAGGGSPNEDAVLYLAREILPLVRRRVPDVVLHVVGADPTSAILALESDEVHVVGYVPDPRAWLDRVRLHLVPMRFGAGVKQKLVDTMAAGLPFVTTPVGAEGLGLGELAEPTVGGTAQELADLTVSMYLDGDRWTAVQRGLLRLAPRHGRPRFRRVLAKALSHAGFPPPLVATGETTVGGVG